MKTKVAILCVVFFLSCALTFLLGRIIGSYTVRIVELDGHRFVVYRNTIIHSPSCYRMHE